MKLYCNAADFYRGGIRMLQNEHATGGNGNLARTGLL